MKKQLFSTVVLIGLLNLTSTIQAISTAELRELLAQDYNNVKGLKTFSNVPVTDLFEHLFAANEKVNQNNNSALAHFNRMKSAERISFNPQLANQPTPPVTFRAQNALKQIMIEDSKMLTTNPSSLSELVPLFRNSFGNNLTEQKIAQMVTSDAHHNLEIFQSK